MTSLCASDVRTISVTVTFLAVLILHVNTGGARAADESEDAPPVAVPIATWTACEEGQGQDPCPQGSGLGSEQDGAASNVMDNGLCAKGFHGDNCTEPCPANCVNGTCDQDSGTCTHGCVPGFTGVNCTQVTDSGLCPKGFHGDRCTDPCPANCVNGTCSRATGSCTHGCVPGFTGVNCTQGCPHGFYGDRCLRSCPEHCRDGKCDAQTGVCYAGCKGDYWGSDCTLGVDMSRETKADRLKFYQHLSAEGKSVLLYLLASRYEHALARAQLDVEQALEVRNDIRHFLRSPGKAPT